MMCADGRRFMSAIGLMRGIIASCLLRFICILLSTTFPLNIEMRGKADGE